VDDTTIEPSATGLKVPFLKLVGIVPDSVLISGKAQAKNEWIRRWAHWESTGGKGTFIRAIANSSSPHRLVRREAALLPTVPGITFSGKAEIMFVQSGTATQPQFSVRVERAVPNNSYRVLVNISTGEQLDFGFVETDREGNASVMWRSTPKDGERDIKPLLPSGRDVRDFARVMVAHGGGTLIFLSGKI